METVVLIKPVPDLGKIKISRGQGQIFETGKQLMNSYDRVGLQLAVDLRQKYGGKVSVISLCDTSTADILREAYAMGADACFNLWEESFKANDAFVNTKLFGAAINKIGAVDLVICGAKSDSGFAGQTGPRLAEYLDLSQATSVTKIELSDKTIKIESKNGNEKEISLPALITVDLSVTKPKIPDALNIMKAYKKEISTWTATDLDLVENEVGEAGALINIKSRFLAEE